MRALIAHGTNRYSDPWHPFAKTTPRLADVVAAAGFDDVDIDDDVDHAMSTLAHYDLLIVNAADPWRDESASTTRLRIPDASIEGFSRALQNGIGVLAVHSALASLRDYPDWAAAIGGMWVPGQSWHPPAERTAITVAPLPDGTPLEDFDVTDERYLRLQLIGRSHIVAWHPVEQEPAAWVRTHHNSRVAVSALGHDEASYDSPGHTRFLSNLAAWTTRH